MDLFSTFTFCNLLHITTHLHQGKKVSILILGDVNSSSVTSRQDLLETVHRKRRSSTNPAYTATTTSSAAAATTAGSAANVGTTTNKDTTCPGIQ
jgi:hypothetical protein